MLKYFRPSPFRYYTLAKQRKADNIIISKDIKRRAINMSKEKLKNIKTSNVEKNAEEMKKIIINEINLKGPIGIDDYMKMCLYDKNFGYYTTKEYIFGEKGDFVTAPEVSSLFGERIGVFIANSLETSFNFPDEYEILEIGAGRGFLMSDIITTLISCNLVKGLHAVIVETSPKLIKIQQENIVNNLNKKKIFTEFKSNKEKKYERFTNKDYNFSITWYNDLDLYIHHRNKIILDDSSKHYFRNVPKFLNAKEDDFTLNLRPLVIINNEFFDALPTKKFIYKDSVWKEILIGVVKEGQSEVKTLSDERDLNKEDKIRLTYTLSEPNSLSVQKYLDPGRTFGDEKIEEGLSYEFSIEQIKYMHSLCYLLATTPKSYGLFCDYGEYHAFSDSFRAIKNQKILKGDDILTHTGTCDLTSYVNFKALSRVVYQYSSLKYGGLMTQGDFLYYLHTLARVEELLKSGPNQKKNLDNVVNRLMHENEMGSTYKFFYVHKSRVKPSYPFLEDILDELKYNK